MLRIKNNLNKKEKTKDYPYWKEPGSIELSLEIEDYLAKTREIAQAYYRRFAEPEAVSE